MSKDTSDRNFKYTSTVPCVYDLLNLEQTGSWDSNGRITLNRPSITNKADKIKFRSFSANIRSDIENLSSPSITAKLCGNFSFYNKPTSTFNPPNTADSDVITDTEIGIIPTISDLTVQIYNQSGFQQYQAANGIYQNGVNNEITFSEFSVPLVTSFEDSINDMLNYAKYNFNKLMGLFDDSTQNEKIYDASTFVYGDINIKPHIPNLGDNKFINVSYSSYYDTTENKYNNLQLSYNPTTNNPPLVSNLLQYSTDKLLNPTMSTYEDLKYFPFGFFRITPAIRSAYTKLYFTGYSNPKKTLPLNTPWDTEQNIYIADFFDPTKGLDDKFDMSANGYISLGSVYQNGNSNMLVTFYKVRNIVDYSKLTKIDDMRRIRNFRFMFDELNEYTDTVGITCMYKFYSDGYINQRWSVNNLKAHNTNDDVLFMRNDEYYLLHAHIFRGGDDVLISDYHILLFYVKGRTLKVLEYIWPEDNLPDTSVQFITMPVDVHNVTTIELPDELECFANEWNETNYLRYVQELNGVHVANSPVLILPRYVNGSNDFLYIMRHRNGETEIYNSYHFNKDIPNDLGYNYFVNDNIIYATQYPKNNSSNEPYRISAFGPMCFLYDGGNDIVDDKKANISYGYGFNNNQTTFYNKFFVIWNYRRFTHYGRDITASVKKHNIIFPIFNAFGTYDFTTVAYDVNNDPVNLTDKIIWIVDSNGNQLYIKDQTFENIYSFAQSSLAINFNLYPNQGSLNNPTFVQLYPAVPTIAEPSGISSTSYSWVNTKHISQIAANPYFYAAESSFNFNDNVFKLNDDGTITFPCIPVVSVNGDYNGLFTFFVKFETNPAILTFDPNIKQSNRFVDRYNYCKQFVNKTPSLYNDVYPFKSYLYYNNETLYRNVTTYLQLQNTDLTLKLLVSGFPSLNNIMFYLNEESLIDFKEMTIAPFTNTIECTLLDSNGDVLTPDLAKNIYKSITISADWSFFV